jgi:hypothetical protein
MTNITTTNTPTVSYPSAVDGLEVSAVKATGLRFMTARELRSMTPEEPTWIWDGILYEGGITALVAPPKIGKSTFTAALARAVAGFEDEFVGRAIVGTPVVYLSEESAVSFRDKLPDTDALSVVTREHAWPLPAWPAVIEAALAEADRMVSRLIVIDTLAFWAAMGPEREKDAGAALAVMNLLGEITRNGIAVMLLAHSRKGGGEDGEAWRGSSAFAAAVDVIIDMERIAEVPRQRTLHCLSRFPSTPGTLVEEMDRDGVWSCVSTSEERESKETVSKRARDEVDREGLLSALADGEELSRDDLEQRLGTPARQWHSVLDGLVKDGPVVRNGDGKRGDPYRYLILRTVSAQDGAQYCAETGEGSFPGFCAPRRGAAETETETAETAQTECAETIPSPLDAPLPADFQTWNENVKKRRKS